MILVERPDGVHDHSAAQIQQRMKLDVQRGIFDLELTRRRISGITRRVILIFDLRKELNVLGYTRSYKKAEPPELELMPNRNTRSIHILPVCLDIAADGNRRLPQLQKRPVINSI